MEITAMCTSEGQSSATAVLESFHVLAHHIARAHALCKWAAAGETDLLFSFLKIQVVDRNVEASKAPIVTLSSIFFFENEISSFKLNFESFQRFVPVRLTSI
jgi:hypothetical protein